MKMLCSRAGFTLVELAVVLTIIGLIIGGVIVGADMIRSAGMNAAITEEKKFVAAASAFRDKYQYLPGDMPNATSFWGAADGSTGSTAACLTALGTGTQTCNGNGDGQITNVSWSAETLRFWQQLANAGLIEGQFTGVVGTGIKPGTNVPVTRLNPGAGWFTKWVGTISSDASRFDGTYNNTLQVTLLPSGMGVLKPSEAYALDTKVDDGKPFAGMFVTTWSAAASPSATACTTAASSADFTATYTIASTTQDCAVFFRNIW